MEDLARYGAPGAHQIQNGSNHRRSHPRLLQIAVKGMAPILALAVISYPQLPRRHNLTIYCKVGQGIGSILEICHILIKRAHHGWIQPLQKGQNLVANEIALVFAGGIGAVFPPFDPVCKSIALNLFARHIQHRAPYSQFAFAGNGHKGIFLHSANAPQTSAPDKVQQQGFGIVVCIVRHHHAGISVFTAHSGEKTIAQVPGCHFYAQVMLPCIFLCVEIRTMEGDAAITGPFADKVGIAVTVLPSQVEIAVGDAEFKFLRINTVGQNHRVNSAAHREQQLPVELVRPGFHQLVLLAMVQVKPKARDSLNCTRGPAPLFAQPSAPHLAL